MAGAKRRSGKKKGTARRRKSGYTKRKSSKKSYKKRSGRKYKTKKGKRKGKRKSRSAGPTVAEMAFVVANHHPDPAARANAAGITAAVQEAQAQRMDTSQSPAVAYAPPTFAQAFQDINEEKTDDF